MQVFMTGATGFVGSAVVRELLNAGHSVSALARSDDAASTLNKTGVQVYRGDLSDLECLRQYASSADGVIHTAYIHDFANFAEAGQVDKRAIEALGEALAGSDRPLIVTSGVALLAQGNVVTEDTPAPAGQVPRMSEQAAEYASTIGVNATSIRLPPTVHGEGDHGFLQILIAIAREKGESAYIGEGLNHWPAVHRLDAAALYRLILERGAPEPRYHGIAEQGVPFRNIAEVIGRQLGLAVVSKSEVDAVDHFGWFVRFASLDCRASSHNTREQMGWVPTHLDLISDLDQNYYFMT